MENDSTNCRLCLATKATSTINMFDEGNKNIASVIAKHFWFEIKDEDINKYICAICWSIVDNFHEFYNQVYDLHSKFYSKMDIDDERNLSACLSNHSDILVDIGLAALELKPKLENDKSEKGTFNSNSKTAVDENSDDNSSSVQSVVTDGDDNIIIISKPRKCHNYEKNFNTGNPEQKSRIISSNIKIGEENKQIQEYLLLECELCSIRCDSFTSIKVHYRKEHKMKGYLRCCNRKFTKRSSLVDHIDRHLHPEMFKCDICNKSYVHKRGLLEHHKWHLSSEKRPFKCPKCPKRYTKKVILDNHLTTHNIEKKFVCDDCGKSYLSKKLLQAHTKYIHGGANIHFCDVCAKEFRSKVVFELHQKTVHENIVLPKVQCQVCGKWLKHKHSLRQHMVRHEDSKVQHFCSICGKQSLNRKALVNHIYTVHSDKVYNCSMCKKTFKKPKSLKEHMATHTGVTLYSCPYCPKTFNSSANMYSHKKKIHVKEWEEQERLKATGV